MTPVDDPHHHHGSELSEMQLRVRALETILTEKGYIDPKALDVIVDAYETKIGPHLGARVVARAWADPGFKDRLLADAAAAVGELGLAQATHLIAVENTPQLHNMVVCTLCSCYPWPVLGLPPSWYKDPAYRARVVREPRTVLLEMGLELAADVQIIVRDSTSEVRWLVIPERPAGTEHLSEEELVSLVTRDSMVGVAKVTAP